MSIVQVLSDPFLLREILFKADYDTVINYCRSYVQAQEICKDNVFWIQKAQHDFGTSPDEFRNTALSPNIRYLEIFIENGGVANGADDFINMENFVKRAIRQNKDYLLVYAIEQGFEDVDLIVEEYAAKGNQQMVDCYLRLTSNYQNGIRGALKGGHIDLFQYLFKKAPRDFPWYWVELDRAAGESGKKEVLESYGLIRGLNGGFRVEILLEGIAESGNQELFDDIRNSMPTTVVLRWDMLLAYALKSKNITLFNHILALAPPDYPNLINIDVISTPLIYGNISLFNYGRSLLPPEELENEDWQDYTELTLLSGKRASFDCIRNLASQVLNTLEEDYNWNELANIALRSGNKYLFSYVQSLAPLNYSWDWNYLIIGAIHSGNRKLINYVRSLMPPNYQPDWNIINRGLPIENPGNIALIEYTKKLFTS